MLEAYSRVLAVGSELDGAMVWRAMLAAAMNPAIYMPLTREQIQELFDEAAGADEEKHIRFARALERAHGIGDAS